MKNISKHKENLSKFLSATVDATADLVLPKFTGGAKLIDNKEFGYAGSVYSDRDTKSAFHVGNLLTKFLDLNNIRLKDTIDFDINGTTSKLIFVFGSKSNSITTALLENATIKNLFSFSFGDSWAIHSKKSGKTYSIENPAMLGRSEYESKTDYGIIARYLPAPDSEKTSFIIAGLGSRATEGCGIYFANHWEEINKKFGNKSIAAVILKFLPPVTPENSEVEEWLV